MEILELNMKHFGKFLEHDMKLLPGMNIIYGENETGKTTIHAFIRAMFFGLEPGRGKRGEEYFLRQPWDNPSYFAGAMRIRFHGEIFRIERNFDKREKDVRLICETRGEELEADQEVLSLLLAGMGEEAFRNTVFIPQTGCATDEGLMEALQKFMVNFQETRDARLDVKKALELLKGRRRELEGKKKQEQEAIDQEISRRQVAMEYIHQEMYAPDAGITEDGMRASFADGKDRDTADQRCRDDGGLSGDEGYRINTETVNFQEHDDQTKERETKEYYAETEEAEDGRDGIQSEMMKKKRYQPDPEEAEDALEGSEDLAREERLIQSFPVIVMGLLILGGILALAGGMLAVEKNLRLGLFALSLCLLAGSIAVFYFTGKKTKSSDEIRQETLWGKIKRKLLWFDGQEEDDRQGIGETGRGWPGEDGQASGWRSRIRKKDAKVRSGESETGEDWTEERGQASGGLRESRRKETKDGVVNEKQSREAQQAMEQARSRWKQEEDGRRQLEQEVRLETLQREIEELYHQREQLYSYEQEIQAVDLAMQRIQELSRQICREAGTYFTDRASGILAELTRGRYTHIALDEKQQVRVNTPARLLELRQVSRGTMDQMYFSLRMAAGELLAGEEPLPIILDEAFAMYDEERLAAALYWLEKSRRQVILFTCQKREKEILDRIRGIK